jgi:deoxyribodipyrimidine photo-lyase
MRRKKALVWFRNDLRIDDHPALEAAYDDADEVYTAYCLNEELFKISPLGFPRMGAHRRKFLIESVSDLQQKIHELGGHLIIVKGNPANLIADIAKRLGVDCVYYSKEVCTEEVMEERALQELLSQNKIDWEAKWTSTLVEKKDLPFSIHGLPDVFTKFRTKVEKEQAFHIPEEKIDGLYAPEKIDVENFDLSTLLPSITLDDRGVMEFAGGETAAKARLKEYLWDTDHIATYKETRNGMVGKNYSSKFSPWLALGCISPAVIAEETWKYEDDRVKNDSTYWMIFELLWRDFFKFTAAKQGSSLFKLNGFNQGQPRKWRRDMRTLESWIDGYTGDEFVDANMLELKHTGWMSNRGRQNVASYFVHDLGMDWRWGASYFESQLIDYDPASNWGNWAYIAGVGNDPRPDRKFNSAKQANDYDKNRTFRDLWLKRQTA